MDLPKPPEDQELRNIIDKLAQFVARNGPEFEQMTKNKQKDNPKFAFLFGGEYFNYYQYKVTTEQAILKQKQKALEQQVLVQHAISQQQQQQPPIQTAPWQPHIQQQQQQQLQEQINQSERNLAAQHHVLMQQQQLQVDTAIRTAQEDKLHDLAKECEMDLQEADKIMQPIIDSCTKDSISAGKSWIFSHATSTGACEVIARYLTKRITALRQPFDLKLHLIYLINDVLHHCVRKNADELKQVLGTYIIPIFCITSLGANEEQKLKLSKLLKLWESNKYFEPSILEQLKEPRTSLTAYQRGLINEFSSVVAPITSSIQTQYAALQKQHQDFVAHINATLQPVASNQTPPPSQTQSQQQQVAPQPTPVPSQPPSQPPQNSHQQTYSPLQHQSNPQLTGASVDATAPPTCATDSGTNAVNSSSQPFPQQQPPPPNFLPNFSQPPPHFNQPPPGFHPPFNQPPPAFSQPPPAPPPAAFPPNAMPLPDMSKPPPGFPPLIPPQSAPNNVNELATEQMIAPNVPYYELPAGLMTSLVKLEDCEYKPLDPNEISLPPPQAPSERLLQAVEMFYSLPSHDRPRNSDGWEQLGLYEFFKAKSQAKKKKEEEIRDGKRPRSPSRSKSRSHSRERQIRSWSRSPPRRRYREEGKSKSRSRSRSTSKSPLPYRRKSRSRSPPTPTKSHHKRRSASRSPTPPSFFGGAYSTVAVDKRLDESNKGHQLLKKMGWGGAGLGAEEQGIQDPISGGEIRDRQDQYKGIGINLNDPFENFRKSKGQAFINRMRARAEEKLNQ